MVRPLEAALLGIVEGATEFLPISSTGHLILASRALRLHGEAINTFDVVIQAGSLAAVAALYRRRFLGLWRGLWGGEAAGRRLLACLVVSFLPSTVMGLLLHRLIKARLFSVWPVTAALALGGLFMIGFEAWRYRARATAAKSVESLTLFEAFLIGCAQCLALWPGTSRAMVTIVAGLLCGLSATTAAEYSFLLAVPTLGVAMLFDAAVGGRALFQGIGGWSLAVGFLAAALTAVVAIRGLLQALVRWGLTPFGWYRLGLAAAVWWAAS